MNEKIQELKKKLNIINWDIKGNYPNRFIYNDLGKKTHFRVMGDKIEVENDKLFGKDFGGNISFYFEGSEIKELSDNEKVNCISIGTKDCFINLYNH